LACDNAKAAERSEDFNGVMQLSATLNPLLRHHGSNVRSIGAGRYGWNKNIS
jgi:hypothetical protein